MARRQTRRTVNVSRDAYTAARAKAEAEGRSLASIVEQMLRDWCGMPQNPNASGWVRVVSEPSTPVVLPSRAELDAIAAARVAQRTSAQQVTACDAEAERRREAAAEAMPCRRNCGDDSWHGVGWCQPKRKPWTRRTSANGATPGTGGTP